MRKNLSILGTNERYFVKLPVRILRAHAFIFVFFLQRVITSRACIYLYTIKVRMFVRGLSRTQERSKIIMRVHHFYFSSMFHFFSRLFFSPLRKVVASVELFTYILYMHAPMRSINGLDIIVRISNENKTNKPS